VPIAGYALRFAVIEKQASKDNKIAVEGNGEKKYGISSMKIRIERISLW